MDSLPVRLDYVIKTVVRASDRMEEDRILMVESWSDTGSDSPVDFFRKGILLIVICGTLHRKEV